MNNFAGGTGTRAGKPQGIDEMQQNDVLERVSKLVKDLYDSVRLIKKLESEMSKNAGLEDHFKKVIISQQQRFRTDVWKNLEDILKGYDQMLKYWSPKDVLLKISRLSRLSIEEINIVISHCIQLEDRLRQEKDKQVPGRFTRTCESGEILIDYSYSLEIFGNDRGSYKTNRLGSGTRVLVDPGHMPVAQNRVPAEAQHDKYISRTGTHHQLYLVPPLNDSSVPFSPPNYIDRGYPASIADVHSTLLNQKNTGSGTEKSSLVLIQTAVPPHFPMVARPPPQQYSRPPSVPYCTSEHPAFQGPSFLPRRPSLPRTDWPSQVQQYPALSSPRIPSYTQSYPVHTSRLRGISSTRQQQPRYSAYPPKGGLRSVPKGDFRHATHILQGAMPNPQSRASPPAQPQEFGSFLLRQILNRSSAKPSESEEENHADHSTARNGLLPTLKPRSKQVASAPGPVNFGEEVLKEIERVVEVHDPTVPQKLMLKNDRLQVATTLQMADKGVEIVEVDSDDEEEEKVSVDEQDEEDDIEIVEERTKQETLPSARVRMCAQTECMNVGVRICKRCHSVIYCSDTCQLRHWRLKHKDECEKLRQLREE